MGRPKSKVSKVVVSGPLAPFSAAYRSWLADLGYTPLTIVNELRQVGHLSRWMVATDVEVADLTLKSLEGFLEERRADAGSANCSLQGLRLLPAVLHDLGVTPEEKPPAPAGAAEALLALFRRHLLAERGLAECTADAYVARARRFLAGCADLSTTTSAEVTGLCSARRRGCRSVRPDTSWPACGAFYGSALSRAWSAPTCRQRLWR